MSLKNGFLPVVIGTLLIGCSGHSDNDNETVNLEQERAALRAAYIAADEAAHGTPPTNVEKLLSYYDNDASVYAQGEPIVAGRENLEKMFAGMTFSKVRVTELNAEVSAAGDLGYTSGTFELLDGSNDTGKYLTVWRKHSDGSWKILEDMFNTDTGPLLPTQ